MCGWDEDMEYGLNALIYGHSKQGKTWLADTTPPPRLVLDAEAGSRFTPSRKINWDPKQPPPKPDGTWDTAIVSVRAMSDVNLAYSWLNSGKHPFRSVVLDSCSEIQQRLVDQIAGTELMKTQDWGTLLRTGSDLIRKFRDLVTNPIKPLDAVIYIAMTKRRDDGVWIPWVQGSLATVLPYYVDLCGFLAIVPQDDGTPVRRLFIGPIQGYETGERVGGRLGSHIDNPNVTEMLAKVRGDAPAGQNGKQTAVAAAPKTEAIADPWLPKG